MRVTKVVECAVVVSPDGANWKIIVVVVRINITSEGNLVKIVLALRQFCLPLGRRQGWQQQRRQNGDDGNDHQQFNEGEPPQTTATGTSTCPAIHKFDCQTTLGTCMHPPHIHPQPSAQTGSNFNMPTGAAHKRQPTHADCRDSSDSFLDIPSHQ